MDGEERGQGREGEGELREERVEDRKGRGQGREGEEEIGGGVERERRVVKRNSGNVREE